MHASTLNRKSDIGMQNRSRLLCTTAGRETRARTHTHTHQPMCRWLVSGFHRRFSIPSSRTRRRGSYTLSRKVTSTQSGLLPPYFGGHGLRGTQFYFLYEYKSTNTVTWRAQSPTSLALRVQNYKYWHLKNNSKYFFFNILIDTQTYSQPYQWEHITKSYGCTSFRPAQSAMIEDYIRHY